MPPEDANELNTVLCNILKNIWYILNFNKSYFGIIYDFDFETFGFINLLSLLL